MHLCTQLPHQQPSDLGCLARNGALRAAGNDQYIGSAMERLREKWRGVSCGAAMPLNGRRRVDPSCKLCRLAYPQFGIAAFGASFALLQTITVSHLLPSTTKAAPIARCTPYPIARCTAPGEEPAAACGPHCCASALSRRGSCR